MLPNVNMIQRIWQVLMKNKNFPCEEINERSFSNPRPCTAGRQLRTILQCLDVTVFWFQRHFFREVIKMLTHWGRVTHICVGKLTIIGSDNGLSPGRRQAIIWTNAEILLIGPLGTNFSENLIGIQIFSFKKMHLKMSSAKWRLFRLGLNELTSLPAPRFVLVCYRCLLIAPREMLL